MGFSPRMGGGQGGGFYASWVHCMAAGEKHGDEKARVAAVRFSSGLGVERFEQVWFSVRMVLRGKGLLAFH